MGKCPCDAACFWVIFKNTGVALALAGFAATLLKGWKIETFVLGHADSDSHPLLFVTSLILSVVIDYGVI